MNTIKLNTIGLNDVSLNYVGAKVRANSGGGGEDLAAIPFYVEAIEPLSAKFTNAHEYSRDNKTWTSANNEDIAVEAGQRVYFRATNEPGWNGIGKIQATNKYNVGGNIMSMLYGDGFAENQTMKDSAFYYLFEGQTKLVSAKELKLVAMELMQRCYEGMFRGCTSLVDAPELPATTLSYNCYQNLFFGCTSLVDAPELPALEIKDSAYYSMFRGCTSLVVAPKLKALKLYENCYGYMFFGCTSLVVAPELPALEVKSMAYQSMFNGCTSLTQAPELPATTLDSYCYQYTFANCTSLVNAPELPALELKSNCYKYMFQNCASLKYVKAMFTTTPNDTYTSAWLSGVAANGTFVKNAAATWDVIGINGVPEGWTIETADA